MWNTTSEPFTLRSVVERALKKHRQHVAVMTNDRSVTYENLDRMGNALANELAEMGISRSDRVALFMHNSVEFVVARLAIIKAGATFVPINPSSSPSEIEHKVTDSATSVLVTDASLLDRWEHVSPSVAEDISLVVAGDPDTETGRSFETLLDRGVGEEPPSVNSQPEDLAGHHFTGGTTGKAKGVLFSQEARTLNLYAHIIEFGIDETDTILLTTPLAHAARLFLKSGLLVGATVYIHDSFEADQWLDTIESEDVTLTFMVPTMIYRILDSPRLETTDTGSLRTVVYGAAPMSTTRIREAIDVIGPVFKQMYGQTEVPDLVTTLDKQAHKQALNGGNVDLLQSAGSPCSMADVRVVDVETNEPVPTGEEGEILATAPYMMEKYNDRPQSTAETIDNGWVHTGDVGRIDEDGHLYILDRLDNVIISGGMNVYSVEVEDALVSHPAVGDSCVIGVPDNDWGEVVTAVVVPEGEMPDPDRLKSHVGDQIADYKKPKRIEFVDSLPKTAYGKIDKEMLTNRYSIDQGEP